MAKISRGEKVIVTRKILVETEDRVTEICKREDRSQGWVLDKAVEIAYPVLLGEAVVIPAPAKTE
jgi:hypothetical protein